MELESICSSTRDDHVQPTQDHDVLSDYKGHVDDDGGESSSSSSSVDIRARFNATKNEAFRNSVRKVLTCLAAFPRNKGLLQPSDLRDILTCNTSPTDVTTTKMQVLDYP